MARLGHHAQNAYTVAHLPSYFIDQSRKPVDESLGLFYSVSLSIYLMKSNKGD
jgi:hypothetical protein